MIKKILENQFIEVENEQEQFSIIAGFNDLTFDENPKLDDFIYKSQDYDLTDLPFGQKYFILSCFSLEEFYEVLGYLVGNGYRKRIKTKISNPHEYMGDHFKKEVWTLDRIQEEKIHFEKMVNILEPFQYQLKIFITVDKKKLNEFRELLKGLPGFKINWLLVDREPMAESDRVFI